MTTLSPSRVATASMRRVDPAEASPTPHLCQAAWDIATIVSAAVAADDSLIVKDAPPLRLIVWREKPDEAVVAIDIAGLVASTSTHGNPRLSALADILLAFTALNGRHTAAYRAVRNTVRMIVEPQYWDELLD